MKFSDIAECLRKQGYTEKETLPHHRVFYEFGTMDFLISDVAKKYEMDYFDGEVEKNCYDTVLVWNDSIQDNTNLR